VLGNACDTVKNILHFARNFRVERVVVGCDFDFDNYGMTPKQGITRLCQLADELFRTKDVELRNIASISDHAKPIQYPFGHHYTTSWFNSEGGLSFLCDPEVKRKNNLVNDFVRYYGWLRSRLEKANTKMQKRKPYEDHTNVFNDLEDLKRIWCSSVGGIEYRHPEWTRNVHMNMRFYRTSGYTMNRLKEIDESLQRLE
jgi:hypothetical protein